MDAFFSEVVLFVLLLLLSSSLVLQSRAGGSWKLQHDVVYPPIPIPTAPVFNPVTTIPSPPVPATLGPGIITVPSAIPPPMNPQLNPGLPLTGNAPAIPGQSWCVVRSGAAEQPLQAALDYACGIGGADCSAIQMGASCFYPDTLTNHASFAFNSYYQKNPVPTSCDFGGNAVIININPSSGSCIFTTWSPSTALPATASPFTAIPIPTPTTESSSSNASTGYGTPPTVYNPGNPGFGGGITVYGGNPPADNSSSSSTSKRLKHLVDIIVLSLAVVAGRISFHI